MEKQLKYPNGSFIEWCEEYYKVIDNFHDHSAMVMDMGGDISRNFYFEYQGEVARLLTNEDEIVKAEGYLAGIK